MNSTWFCAHLPLSACKLMIHTYKHLYIKVDRHLSTLYCDGYFVRNQTFEFYLLCEYYKTFDSDFYENDACPTYYFNIFNNELL